MSLRLDPNQHEWMTRAATRRVIAALEAVRKDSARFVGGCVRDALLGRPAGDIDIATPLRPEAAAEALKTAGVAVIPTGIEHGTLTAVCEHQPFEITSLRRDVSTDGRRATVTFTESWEEDSARRDFRLNAVYAAPDGTLYDPQGGVADARAGRIVFIGDARARIREDYLRILRFFRFYAWFGRGQPDPAGLSACAEMVSGLARLSAERVWKEIKALLAAPDPRRAIEAMRDSGVLGRTLGNHLDAPRLLRLIGQDAEHGFAADPLLRFAALCGPQADADEIAARLRLSKAERTRLHGALAEAAETEQAALERAIYCDGREAAVDRIRLAAASPAPPEAWREALAHAQAWPVPEFPVKAADLMARGHEPGKALGAAMKRLEAEWIAARFTLSKAALLARA
ncbi:MAG: CCA tRNA nucleotidyltransferase [Maricaulaceae bacterium]|nr:CCA tRNA nucleotidyltransferase [Maricaulaceae bacterium]